MEQRPQSRALLLFGLFRLGLENDFGLGRTLDHVASRAIADLEGLCIAVTFDVTATRFICPFFDIGALEELDLVLTGIEFDTFSFAIDIFVAFVEFVLELC